jgi:hypothetical protein
MRLVTQLVTRTDPCSSAVIPSCQTASRRVRSRQSHFGSTKVKQTRGRHGRSGRAGQRDRAHRAAAGAHDDAIKPPAPERTMQIGVRMKSKTMRIGSGWSPTSAARCGTQRWAITNTRSVPVRVRHSRAQEHRRADVPGRSGVYLAGDRRPDGPFQLRPSAGAKRRCRYASTLHSLQFRVGRYPDFGLRERKPGNSKE